MLLIIPIISVVAIFAPIIESKTITIAVSGGHKSHLCNIYNTIHYQYLTPSIIAFAYILKQSQLNATFFINSARLTFQDEYLNVFDIDTLVELEFEIGGHTTHHTSFNNPKLETSKILSEICVDRATLNANGWIPKSFAYVDDFYSTQTQLLVSECGYNSAIVNSPFKFLNQTIDTNNNIHALHIDTNVTAEYLISFIDINSNLQVTGHHYQFTANVIPYSGLYIISKKYHHPMKHCNLFLLFLKQNNEEISIYDL